MFVTAIAESMQVAQEVVRPTVDRGALPPRLAEHAIVHGDLVELVAPGFSMLTRMPRAHARSASLKVCSVTMLAFRTMSRSRLDKERPGRPSGNCVDLRQGGVVVACACWRELIWTAKTPRTKPPDHT